MSALSNEQFITPPATSEESDLARESSRLLAACIGRGKTARLRVIDSDGEIEVPVQALRMLVDILNNMAAGNAVSLVPIHAELTTQQAADLLNVSRPYLVGMIENGTLPARMVGNQRRLPLKDVLIYKRDTQAKRRAALDELAKSDQELGLR